MAKPIERRIFAPKVLRRPFDLQKWQVRRPKVGDLLSYTKNPQNQKGKYFVPETLRLARRMPAALAYQTIRSCLTQTDKIRRPAREAIADQVLAPLERKINRQITRRQITTGSLAFLFLSLIGTAYHLFFNYGRAAEQENLEEFAKELRQHLAQEEEKTALNFIMEEDAPGPFLDFGPIYVPLDESLDIRDPRNYQYLGLLRADLGRYPSSSQIVNLAGQAALPKLEVISTAASDERISGERATYDSAIAAFSRREFTDFYRKVVRAPLLDPPSSKKYLALGMRGAEYLPSDPTGPMPIFSLLLHNEKRVRAWFFYMDELTIFDKDPTPLRQAYSYVQFLAPEIDRVSDILAQAHHTYLHKENIRLFLRWELFSHQQEMTSEDPWQDLAACREVSCGHQAVLEKTYHEYEGKVGVEFLGGLRDLSGWIWSLASHSYKYNLSKQGLGPYQIIVGLAERAARQSSLLQRYAPFLTRADFSSSDAIVRSILDPRKSVYVKALVTDLILSQLEKTLFSNNQFRVPINIAPFIGNMETAREYSLLYLTHVLAMFPEYDFLAPQMLAVRHVPYYLDLLYLGELFGIKPDFPSLFYIRWENSDNVVFSDYSY